MLFARWGAFVYRFRLPTAILAVAFAVVSAMAGANSSGALSAGGWADPESDSAAVSARLADDFGAGRGSLVVLFQGSRARTRDRPRRRGPSPRR